MPAKTLPNEKGAPRVQGMVNGSSCQLILDSGCTSFVISLDFAKRAGITELEPVNVNMVFADGKSHKPLGIASSSIVRLCYISLQS
jgi:predicted aspartyl protease